MPAGSSSARRGRRDVPDVLLCVGIDCECDKGRGWRVRAPLSFDGMTRGIGERLQPLFARYRAKPTYLLSPEVLRDPRSVELLRALTGCELGTHLHGEFADADPTPPPRVTEAVQRDYSREVESGKLAFLTELFTQALSRPPRSFRAGRFGIGPNTLEHLAGLGYYVDSSVTPHLDWSARGVADLSFQDAPSQPYFPDPRQPARPGGSSILEIPVTIRPRLPGLPWMSRRLERRWLRPTHGSTRSLLRTARDEIAEHRGQRRPVVLNAMFHNVEVVPGCSPYAHTERAAAGILGRLDALLAFARRQEIPVVGLTDVLEHFV